MGTRQMLQRRDHLLRLIQICHSNAWRGLLPQPGLAPAAAGAAAAAVNVAAALLALFIALQGMHMCAHGSIQRQLFEWLHRCGATSAVGDAHAPTANQ